MKTNQVRNGWWLLVKILTRRKFKLRLISGLYQELPSNKTAECVFFCKFCWPYLKQQTIYGVQTKDLDRFGFMVQGCQGHGKVREKQKFFKVREKSGKIFGIVKVSEKSGNSVFWFIVHNFSSRL